MSASNIEANVFKYGPCLASAEYNIQMRDGSNKVVRSSIFNDEPNEGKRIIDIIDDLILSRGLFSSKKINFDDFDNVEYNDEDLLETPIEGSCNLLRFPYNLITFHKKNHWKMRCLNISYKTLYNLIPNKLDSHCELYSYHDLPKEFNFERSDKTIQKGHLNPQEAIKIHKSRSRNDTTEQFYVRVNFTDENLGESFKDVNLVNILKNTPEIKSVNFYFKLLDEVDESDAEKFETIKFYNLIMSKWIINVLEPTIDTYCNYHEINNNFYVRYL